ncbi:MAG: alpha/beta fold hydrolase [Gemmatimonadota bacterium]|nr:alpha/beta fold hydrolase [Gemmatimonadota bacterium]
MRPFEPSWLLPGPHLPTIWGKKARRQKRMHDRVECVETPDGDHLTLARMGRPAASVQQILILHGLEGTIGAKYAHGLLAQAQARGWTGTLMLFRSCDGQLNSAPRLYHSGETTDLDFIVRRLHAESPLSPLFICGVSLGGNVLLKWLGERSQATTMVTGAAAVSVPFDLARGSRYLELGFSRLYAAHFLQTLKTKALAKARQFPGRMDDHRIRAATTFWEFDDAATAPLHGFLDAADYYERSSSIHYLSGIQVPTLLFSAFDDPFVPPDVLRDAGRIAASNPSIVCDFSERGGHVGWVEGSLWPATYYMEARVVEFFAKVHQPHTKVL